MQWLDHPSFRLRYTHRQGLYLFLAESLRDGDAVEGLQELGFRKEKDDEVWTAPITGARSRALKEMTGAITRPMTEEDCWPETPSVFRIPLEPEPKPSPAGGPGSAQEQQPSPAPDPTPDSIGPNSTDSTADLGHTIRRLWIENVGLFPERNHEYPLVVEHEGRTHRFFACAKRLPMKRMIAGEEAHPKLYLRGIVEDSILGMPPGNVMAYWELPESNELTVSRDRVSHRPDAIDLQEWQARDWPLPVAAEEGAEQVQEKSRILPPQQQRVPGRRDDGSVGVAKLIHALGIEEKVLQGFNYHGQVHNPPWMDLVIECLPLGDGDKELSLTHYFTQNGDRVNDGEMTFRVDMQSGRMSLLSNTTQLGGRTAGDPYFSRLFAKNLLEQGFGNSELLETLTPEHKEPEEPGPGDSGSDEDGEPTSGDSTPATGATALESEEEQKQRLQGLLAELEPAVGRLSLDGLERLNAFRLTPNSATWDEVFSLILYQGRTCWQAWIDQDPQAPRRAPSVDVLDERWPQFPSYQVLVDFVREHTPKESQSDNPELTRAQAVPITDYQQKVSGLAGKVRKHLEQDSPFPVFSIACCP